MAELLLAGVLRLPRLQFALGALLRLAKHKKTNQ